jgi:hypothetical protein
MVARTLSISGSAPEFGEIEARPAGNAIASDPSKGEGIRFALDSPLEEQGFEPSVPPA